MRASNLSLILLALFVGSSLHFVPLSFALRAYSERQASTVPTTENTMTKQIGISRITGKPLMMPRKSSWRPSDELAPVNRPRDVAVNRLGNHTETQQLLGAVADRMLRKSRFFTRKGKTTDVVVDAESITVNGQLRPTWQGRP